MSDLTTDPTDPRLGRGSDELSRPQNAAYLVLSEEERAKGFVRPVRQDYVHVGESICAKMVSESAGALGALGGSRKICALPAHHEGECGLVTRIASQPEHASAEINHRWGGCGARTSMALPLAETYARDPKFYGSTYCYGCKKHRLVFEFIWDADGSTVGS